VWQHPSSQQKFEGAQELHSVSQIQVFEIVSQKGFALVVQLKSLQQPSPEMSRHSPSQHVVSESPVLQLQRPSQSSQPLVQSQVCVEG